MMEWYVRIKGDSFGLKNLSKSLNSPELCITKIGQDYILKSTDFNSIKKAEDVRNKANDILSLINGSARLVFGMRKPLGSDLISLVNDDGKIIKRFMLISGTLYLQGSLEKISVIKKDGTVQEIFQVDIIPEIISIAQNDENVDTVLRILGDHPIDLVNLYNILEVVKNDVGGIPKIVEEGWATRNTIVLFKRTANFLARHKNKKIEPPEKLMTLPEAKSLIGNIIRDWIKSKK